MALTWGQCWREVNRWPKENPRRIHWLSLACRSSPGVGGCTCLKNFTRRSKTARTRRRSSLSLGVTKSLSSCHCNMSKASNSRMLSKNCRSCHFQGQSRVGWQRFHGMEWLKCMAACETDRAGSINDAPGNGISPWNSYECMVIYTFKNPDISRWKSFKWKFFSDRSPDSTYMMIWCMNLMMLGS